MKVLHILYQSLPQVSGSSIRSRDILMSQKEIGLDPVAVTSPFQSGLKLEENINGIRYLRSSIGNSDTISDEQKPFLERLKRLFSIIPFYNKLKKLIKSEKPQILHAHAMFFCGLPAIYLGKKFRLPVIYEVRSLWMLKKNSNRRKLWDSSIESILFKLELFVMKRANKVVAINENLRDELIKNGIIANKVEVVNNAVNTSLVDCLSQNDRKGEEEFLIKNFGYIGTLTPHEGIDFLIEVFKEFNERHPETRLHIYGKGIEEKKIKALAYNNPNISFFGAIEPDWVQEAFKTIDVIVNPRVRNRLTNSVTPLKPLEAMAYDKLFIGSDVGGITELVTHGENGLLFEAGNPIALMDTMANALQLGTEEHRRILSNAKQFVVSQKSWSANARKYRALYDNLVTGHGKGSDK